MKFLEINAKEYSDFVKKSEQASFFQTISWAEFKCINGWEYVLLGIKDDKNKLIGAGMVLIKNTPIKKKIFYAPRGFILDYGNKKVLEFFTKEIKKYIKLHKGFLFKMDPYVMKIQRDKDAQIVKDGTDNSKIINDLETLGFRHIKSEKMGDNLQVNWLYTVDIKNRTLDDVMKDMDSKTRQMIRKNEKSCVRIRYGTYEELDKFEDIMKHTSDRNNFLNRPLSYYQNMFEILSKEKITKLVFTEINTKEYINNLKLEKATIIKDMEVRKNKKINNLLKMNEEKYLQKEKQDEETILRLEEKIKEIKKLNREHGDVITLGAILFMIYGKEILSLYGGAYKEFMQFQSFYTANYEMIKYGVENKYNVYNFYGISPNLSPNDPLYGIYTFKRGFGGQVVELIGEFDLYVNKFDYKLYDTSYKIVHKLKKLKKTISRKK